METEVLFTPDHVMPRLYDVSPALLAQSPESVVITTRRGREAPLALAGYRLRMGGTYQIRVTGPAREIRLIGFSRLLVQRQGEPWECSDEGVRYWCQEFRVQRAGFWSMVSSLGMYPEELEIESTLLDGRKVSSCVPVVLELGFTLKLVLLLILWAFFLSVSELISATFWDHRADLLSSPVPWLRALALALVYPVMTFARRIYGLKKRAAELQQHFHAIWKMPAPSVRTNAETDRRTAA
jgi:hypothetical protein